MYQKLIPEISFIIILIFGVIIFFGTTNSISAQVVINEILYQPGRVGIEFDEHSHEWVEIYNAGFQPVDLSGWTISNSNGDAIMTLPSWSLPAESFLTIHITTGTNDNDFEDLDGHYYTGDATEVFQNKNDECALYNGTPGTSTIVDFISWSNSGSYMSGTAHNYATGNNIWTSGEYFDSHEIHNADCLARYFDGLDRNMPSDWRKIEWTLYAQNRPLQPENPIQEKPVNRSVIDDNTPTFDWSDFPDGDDYVIEIDNDYDFSSVEIEEFLTESEYTPTYPLPDDVYFFRVRSHLGVEATAWAAEWMVVIKTGGFQKALVAPACPHKWQHKDTHLLCIWDLTGWDTSAPGSRPGCVEHGNHPWDGPHPNQAPPGCPHDNQYCARASIAMVNAKYGGDLSQDRISYEMFKGYNPQAEGDLGHNLGATDNEVTTALSWALNGAAINFISHARGGFTFAELQTWIGQRDCFVAKVPGHAMVINGYAELTSTTGSNIQVIYSQDPWQGANNPSVFSYVIEGAPKRYFRRHRNNTFSGVWLQPTSGVTARSQEASVTTDTDGDGVMDFDEDDRFCSLSNLKDTENDQVPDKQEIRSYTFHDTDHAGHENNALNFPDIDGDNLRAECDCDSDNDGDFDGGEDINGNGISPEAGETCVYDNTQQLLTVSVDKNIYFVGDPVYIVDDHGGRNTHTFHANSTYNYEKGEDCPEKARGSALAHNGSFTTNAGGHANKTLVENCPKPGKFYLTVDVLNDNLYSAPDNKDPQTCWECVSRGVEVDYFENSLAEVTVEMPFVGTETVKLSGPTRVHVYFNDEIPVASDTDDDGLDQVPTEIVEMELTGYSDKVGPIIVRVRDESKCPNMPTVGEIEELYNVTNDWLDIEPFTENCIAASFFDVYFEVEVLGSIYHTHDPKHMEAIITYKPPWEGEVYVNLDEIPLYDEDEQPTGIKITGAHHVPRPLEIHRYQGWSLTALRVFPENQHLPEIFPGADMFGFDPLVGYFPIQQLETHTGFWLHVPDSSTFFMMGQPIHEYQANLPAGWSLVAGLTHGYGLIVSETITGIQGIYRFDPVLGYQPTEIVWPGESVWVYCPRACSVHIVPYMTKKSKIQSPETNWTAAILASGEIVGAAINVSNVVIGIDDITSDVSPAPPSPPQYTTQVRLFALGDFANAYYSDIRKIEPGQHQDVWVLEVDPDGNTPNPPNGRTTTLSWNADELKAITDGTWELREGTDGNGAVAVNDMLMTTSYDVMGSGEKYFTIHSPVITGIKSDGEQQQSVPEKFALRQNYPNPFNATTEIRFELAEATHVSIHIFNISGQVVKTLLNQDINAGFHNIIWNGLDDAGNIMPSGLYIYKIVTPVFSKTMRMILLK